MTETLTPEERAELDDYLDQAEVQTVGEEREQIPFLSQEERAQLIQSETPFYMTNLYRTTRGGYGPRWIATIKIDQTPHKLGFRSSEWRDKKYQRLELAVSKFRVVGPLVLIEVDTGKGNPMVDIARPRLTGESA